MWRVRTLLQLGFALLPTFALGLPALSAAEKEPKPSPLTAAQKERLKERDRFGAETQKLRQAGKLPEAIAAAEKMRPSNAKSSATCMKT